MSKLEVRTQNIRFPVTDTFYGIFFEDINRAGEGGLYPETLRNRTFEDSLPIAGQPLSGDGVTFTEQGIFLKEVYHGEGLKSWIEGNGTLSTPIPAWYADKAAMNLDDTVALNPKRAVSMEIKYRDGGRIWNVGFNGVPAKAGEARVFSMFAKSLGDTDLIVKLESADGKVCDRKAFTLHENSFARYDAVFFCPEDDNKVRLVFEAPKAATVWLGFVSLMPGETYNGHGLRMDLMEKLKGLNPAFVRFPGGSIVGSFNKYNLLRFSNMIGPVWERPTNFNTWCYRTGNGLGFHQWLQMCEDLHAKPMWVFNCALICGPTAPDYFSQEEVDELVQEAQDAIDYATSPVGTRWSDLRASSGHPDPFRMDYMEVGNEHGGEAYKCEADATDDEVLAKFTSMSDKAEHVEIVLDCDVAPGDSAWVLNGEANGVNTMNDPERVVPKRFAFSGAARSFNCTAPAMSPNILRLKKA